MAGGRFTIFHADFILWQRERVRIVTLRRGDLHLFGAAERPSGAGIILDHGR